MISVLFVDDEPVLLDIGRIYLERAGTFTVTPVDSGRAAIDAMNTAVYDVIVSDYEMPGMDGITLLKEIRGKGDDTPFILFTGRGREEVASDALNQGADFYIQKGGDPRAQFTELEHKILKAVDRRQALMALRESERRLADIINFLPDATFAIDINGKIIAWNRELERMTGIPASEMIGKGDRQYAVPFYKTARKTLVDLVLQPDPEMEETYPEFSREGDLIIADNVISDLSDSPRYVRARASVLYGRDGNPAGAIESIRDITDQKMGELRLLESEEKFRAVADYTLDWEIWEDPVQGIIYISPSCERITGYTAVEFFQNPSLISDIVHPDDREAWTVHREVALMRRMGEELDFRIVRRNGDVRWINHVCSPVISSNGQYLGHRASNRDITERVRTEDALRESQRRIHQVVQALPLGLIFFHVDEKGTIIFSGANPSAGRILGIEFTLSLGKPVEDIFPLIVQTPLPEICRDVFDTGETRHIGEFRYDDGRVSGIFELHIFPSGPGLVTVAVQEISDRISKREALDRCVTGFRGLFDHLNYGILVFETPDSGETFHIKDINKNARLFLGRIAENLQNAGLSAILEPERQKLLSVMADVFQTDSELDFQLFLPEKGVYIDGRFFKVPSGQIIWISREPVFQSEDPDDLRIREEKCRIINEYTHELVVVTDHVIIHVNHQFRDLLGMDESDILGHPLNDFLSHEDQPVLEGLICPDIRGECLSLEPVRLTSRTGKVHWFDVHRTPITWESKEASLFSFSDVTDQVTTRLALEESQRYLSGIIDFLPDPTLVIDTNGFVVFWNRAIEEMTGVKSGDVVGKGGYHHGYAFYGIHRPMLIDLIQSPDAEIQSRYSIHNRETDSLVADTHVNFRGEDRVLWGKAVLLRDSHGNIIGSIESIRDITDRTRTEEALTTANKKLSLLSQITRHDVRNKLTGLFGYLDLADENLKDPEINAILQNIRTIAEFISRQIEMTGEYQEIGAGVPDWRDVEDAFDNSISSLHTELVSASLFCGHYEILADPMIDRVFYNLLENAIRHAPGLTKIRYGCRMEGSDLIIFIEDDGPGIPDTMKEQIFERGVGSGTGLGLFLAREILSITGISIRETGTAGQGARFEIHVPEQSFRRAGDLSSLSR